MCAKFKYRPNDRVRSITTITEYVENRDKGLIHANTGQLGTVVQVNRLGDAVVHFDLTGSYVLVSPEEIQPVAPIYPPNINPDIRKIIIDTLRKYSCHVIEDAGLFVVTTATGEVWRLTIPIKL